MKRNRRSTNAENIFNYDNHITLQNFFFFLNLKLFNRQKKTVEIYLTFIQINNCATTNYGSKIVFDFGNNY